MINVNANQNEPYVRAQRLVNRARALGNRQPNLLETYLLLYEIGQRNGWPMNKITAAIVTGGYSATSAAYKIGSGAVHAISNLSSS